MGRKVTSSLVELRFFPPEYYGKAQENIKYKNVKEKQLRTINPAFIKYYTVRTILT